VDADPQPKPFQFRLVHLLGWTAVIAIVLAVLTSAFRAILEADRASLCQNNLRQIGIGLFNYHDVFNRFPPPHLDDPSGKPMHSWRVMISAYVQSSAFPSQYDYAEPWNGPNNSRLLMGPGALFACPSDRSSLPHMTNYVAVTGPGTAWPREGSFHVGDATSDMIVLVEISNSNIHWMEPRDLPIEELGDWLAPEHQPRLFGNHAQGGHVLFADGRVEVLSPEETIERWGARAAGAGRDEAAP
jgi:prepilin-type processing-associated H-X9-DG protein